MQRAVRADHFAQRAIDAKAHTAVAFVGFDVDVAGAVTRGLHQQGVEHADDGRVCRGFQQVFHGGQLLHHAAQVGFAFHLAHHQGRARFRACITGPNALQQRGRVHMGEAVHRVAAQHLAPRPGVRCICMPQRQVPTIVLQQQLVGAGEGVGQRVAHGQLAGALSLRGKGGSTWSLGTGSTGVSGLSASFCRPCICS